MHVWAAFSPTLAACLRPVRASSPAPPVTVARSESRFESEPVASQRPWTWAPPDLSVGSPWCNERVRSLADACKGFPDRDELFRQGLQALARHRRNYGPDGPQTVQLLWWEFPPERWHELIRGCSMNFLAEPPRQCKPNSDMTPPQRAAAGKFYDELATLGILLLPTFLVLAACPLFCVPKPAQPGEWRVIADMKEGGQNSVVGKDPVFVNEVDCILPRLCSGGCSAAADASKMFCQFPTAEEDQPYLGVINPVNEAETRVCGGLPMGAGASPGVAGRMGAALERALCRRCPRLFDGEARENSWHSSFNGSECDGKRGHGFVPWAGEDGLPPVLVFVHVDDFKIHGPAHDKTCRGLTVFVDIALRAGFLFNPDKLLKPSQRIKYVGFIWGTTAEPTLLIPEDKREWSLAMLDQVLAHTEPISRLSLSALNGNLQALVPATPARIGNTFLRRAYDLVCDCRLDDAAELPDMRWDDLTPPSDILCTCVALSDGSRLDCEWWRTALADRLLARAARPRCAASLAPTWGDGSGTGTGGTIRRCDCGPDRQMWMGQWLPSSAGRTSNWKELKTVELTLRRLLASPDAANLRGAVVFCFTDNSVTCNVISKGSSKCPALHALVCEIKLLELRLGVSLEPVHVPGRLMMLEGTDGLSRGLWINPVVATNAVVMSEVFAPVPHSNALRLWVRDQLDLPPGQPLSCRPWRRLTCTDGHLHRLTLWLPPPEMARTLISRLLTHWVESPWDAGMAILLPRILQRQWSSLSRHVQEVGLCRDITVLPFPPDATPVLAIPLILLCIAPHHRSLPTLSENRVGTSADASVVRWHRQQADKLRRL